MIMYVLVFLFMVIVAGLGIWWVLYCRSKPKYNGLLWVHPDKGGGVIDIMKPPASLQKPFYFNYRALEFNLSFFRQPLFLWSQDKVTDTKGIVSYPIIPWEPKEPADFLLQATAKGEPDKSKPYVTTNQLYRKTDWKALKVLETSSSSVTEAIKLGMAIIMVCVCVFGIIVALDMIGKKEQPVATPPPKPVGMFMQPINYGGLT